MQKVQIIIYRKTEEGLRFLLLRKKGEKVFWQGVTGGVEASDEDIKKAALRELKEEIGIDAATENLIGPLYEFTFITHKKVDEGQKVKEFCFGLEILENSRIQLSQEHDMHKWVSYEDALRLISYEEPKKVIKIICCGSGSCAQPARL